MAPCGSKWPLWLNVAQYGSNWLKMAYIVLDGSQWLSLVNMGLTTHYGSKWLICLQMASYLNVHK